MRFKWFFIALVVFLSSLSGIGEVLASTNQPVFLKSAQSLKKVDSRRVLAASSSREEVIPSQISEIKIIEQKYIAPTASPTKAISKYGSSKQIDANTWTIDVGKDTTTANASQILAALNSYRQKNGRSALSFSGSLAGFAQGRASHFSSIGTLDGHTGFMDYVNNQDGFHKLGFGSLGENSSYGYVLEATHLIEQVYAGDAPHDNNQLSAGWTHVGIGVNGTATDLVFGGKKL